ncbi:MAG: hypothetical protein IH803_02705 [Nitrospirae bacterium]|nr:hypothetical protein [Nitrospirota bacterium]
MVSYHLMMLAGFFALFLLLALVLGDWLYFTSLTAPASRYGCRIARLVDHVPLATLQPVSERFDANGVLQLPHGIARFFPEEQRILLRPQYRLLSLRIRTAWPMKASIDLQQVGGTTRMLCTKRVPWSSALITLLWFALVALGTVGFVIAFIAQGGAGSLRGLLMGLGITGVGLVVLAFGLVTVLLAYRLEDQRLAEAYHELRAALVPEEIGSTKDGAGTQEMNASKNG